MSAASKVSALLAANGITPPVGLVVHRTYAGRLQRENGAWSWWADAPSGDRMRRTVCGSSWPVSELAKTGAIVSLDHSTRNWEMTPPSPETSETRRWCGWRRYMTPADCWWLEKESES